jgi:hypothetical protein
MPDGGAGALVVPAGDLRLDVILVARGDAKSDHVDQEVVAFLPGGLRQLGRIDCEDAFYEMFGDGNFGKRRGGHENPFRCYACGRSIRSRESG